jgi:ABC-type Fe3+/spermidine/putrescine transport system ATPase subunit
MTQNNTSLDALASPEKALSPPGEEGRLWIESVSHSYGAARVLKNVTMDVGSGEFLTLLGASGSGKTTLLRIIGGLVLPSLGRIRVGSRDITHLPPEKRDIGFVFQNYALFPHMTVSENVGFALKVRKVAASEIANRVGDVLSLVGLGALGNRYPAQLSGGQQQRVALARAIVFRPGVLLLDEPLGALDRQLRQRLGLELRSLQRRSGITMVYVTHDQEEAFTMSTQVAVMKEGAILQIGAPEEIYRRPADLFVARFVGEINLLDGEVEGKVADGVLVRLSEGILVQAVTDSDLPIGTKARCIARPEHVLVQPDVNAPHCTLRARVQTVIFGGSWHRVRLALEPSGRSVIVEGRGEPQGIVEGADVGIAFDSGSIVAFPADAREQLTAEA